MRPALFATLSVLWLAACDGQPPTSALAAADLGSVGDSVNLAPCGSLGFVDMSDRPRCVEVSRALQPCCPRADALAIRLYAVVMGACIETQRMSDADCAALLAPAWIDAECVHLKRSVACQASGSWGYSSFQTKVGDKGCKMTWGSTEGTLEVSCSGTPGFFDCVCRKDGREGKRFVSVGYCLNLLHPADKAHAAQANEGCGWKIRVEPF